MLQPSLTGVYPLISRPLRPSARRTSCFDWSGLGSIPRTALPASSRARSTGTFSLRSSSWLWTPFGALPEDARCFGLQSILEAKQLLRVFRVQINRPHRCSGAAYALVDMARRLSHVFGSSL